MINKETNKQETKHLKCVHILICPLDFIQPTLILYFHFGKVSIAIYIRSEILGCGNIPSNCLTLDKLFYPSCTLHPLFIGRHDRISCTGWRLGEWDGTLLDGRTQGLPDGTTFKVFIFGSAVIGFNYLIGTRMSTSLPAFPKQTGIRD